MSKEGSKDTKGHHSHGIHLHLPKKPGRSLSAGRVSPISFFTGHRKSTGGQNGNGHTGHNGNGNGSRVGAVHGFKDSASAPSSSHGSPAGSPTHPRKGSFGSVQVSIFACSTEVSCVMSYHGNSDLHVMSCHGNSMAVMLEGNSP